MSAASCGEKKVNQYVFHWHDAHFGFETFVFYKPSVSEFMQIMLFN